MWSAVLEESPTGVKTFFLTFFKLFWPHKDEQKETHLRQGSGAAGEDNEEVSPVSHEVH
jgi:hypothetical protein